MATYHFEIKSGRNASGHADYIARKGFHRAKEDLVSSGYGNLPAWAKDDPKALWKAAEKFERRNGAAYREAVIALPSELSQMQQQALVDDLVDKLAPGKPYQFAIHAPTSSLEGESNPHIHLMTSDRKDDGIDRPAEQFFSRYNPKRPEEGGRKKTSGGHNRMQIRDDVIALRKIVADTINHHLAVNGHHAHVDHRTLKEQGITRKAERHLGPTRVRGLSAQERAAYVSARKDTLGHGSN